MRSRLLEREIPYTGAELRSGWVMEMTGLTGDAAVAFLGPCDVAPEHMVDREDLEKGAAIRSPRMVHVIVEHPDVTLVDITVRQRLLMALAGELLNTHLGESLVCRKGDDLYLRGRKLSVSVATTSPASGLIHAGFNVRGDGAPVPAIGLEELGADPRWFVERLLEAYGAEMDGIRQASGKVKPVQ